MVTRIYKLIDPKEPDVVRYVGKTKSNLNIRLNSHIYGARVGNKFHSARWINNLLTKKIRPIIVLIDECRDEDWEFWEKFYIFKFNNDKLTNIEVGGKSTTLRKYTKVGTRKNTKKIQQFSLNGDLVGEFMSCAEAGRELDLNKHVLAATCRGNQTKAYGFRWKFKNDNSFAKIKHKRSRAVLQYDLSDNIINEYGSVTEAAKETGFSYGGISGCVHHNITRCGKFKFKFKE